MDESEKSFCACLDALEVRWCLFSSKMQIDHRSLMRLQEYIELQKRLGEAFKSGYMNLATARYAMGAERVSLLQMPTVITSSTRLLPPSITGTVQLIQSYIFC